MPVRETLFFEGRTLSPAPTSRQFQQKIPFGPEEGHEAPVRAGSALAAGSSRVLSPSDKCTNRFLSA
jgi:hypothetical protein